MRIERFEDIEPWQLARELTQKVYGVTKKAKFACDYGNLASGPEGTVNSEPANAYK